jgi:SNF family Na+-dependent transporter
MLLTLAVDSAFSLVEAVAASMQDKFGWGHKKSNLAVGGTAFIIGLIFTTGAGLYWLDIVDKWVETFGITAVVLIETLVLGWFYKLDKLRQYANDYSEVKVGKWWIVFIKYLVPIAISALIITETISLIRNGYGDYPFKALLIAGWAVALLMPVLAVIIANAKKQGHSGESGIITPKMSFRDDIGFRRMNRYFLTLLILGLVISVLFILNNYLFLQENLIMICIAIYIFLALVGGAVYFTIISMKDSNERILWSEKAFDDNGEE